MTSLLGALEKIVPSFLIGFLAGCLITGALWFQEVRNISHDRLLEARIGQTVLEGALGLVSKDKHHANQLKADAAKEALNTLQKGSSHGNQKHL